LVRSRKFAIWLVAGGLFAGIAALGVIALWRSREITVVTGAVLRQDSDARKQLPIANVEIAARSGEILGRAKSDAVGLFRLTLSRGVAPGEAITLLFRHPDYEPLEIAGEARDELLLVRMTLAPPHAPPGPNQAEVILSDVRVRYAMKATNVANVGSAVRTFEAVNTGNVPCNGRPPCSPDGKWKAAIGSASLEAGEGNEFRNARVSCIAGPCPFTRVESDGVSRGGRTISVSVRNWSDTATFLIEAEVIRTMLSDLIRHSYPVIFGRAMNFTLPPAAQGPSIEAEVGGSPVVFPLGPHLKLSWAACSVKTAGEGTRAYRCELRDGYRFQ
jgi:hypothetical protein